LPANHPVAELRESTGMVRRAEPSLSVIICVFTEERWQSIVRAVESLTIQSHPPFEVVVVVDYNRSLKHRIETTFPELTVVANTHARGLSGGRNTGIDCTRGEIVAFLDDDARAHVGWVAALLAAYADDSVLGAGGLVLPEWPDGHPPPWFPDEFLWVVGCSYTGQPVTASEVRNVLGANMSFRRTAFERVGLFSSVIGRNARVMRPLSCEETELCIRIRSAFPQSQIVYEPSAIVYHQVDRPRVTWRYFRERCYAEGVSKQLVTESVGARAALSVERRYVMRTLSRAASGELGRFVNTQSAVHLTRLAALTVGLIWTVAGYVSRRAVSTSGRCLRTRKRAR
jgi:glycosyltransferase involved in cell wall biosynthesis